MAYYSAVFSSIGVITGGQNIQVGDNAGTEWRCGQSFTIGSSTEITGGAMRFLPGHGSPAGNVTFRIETESAGKPSGTLADANLTIAITPNVDSDQFEVGIFATPATLSSGTYWLVAQCDNQAVDSTWSVTYDASLTDSGTYSANSGATWNIPYPDMNSYIFGTEVTKVESIVENYEGSNDGDGRVGDNSGTDYELAQSFTLDAEYDISAISMYLRNIVGTPSGTIKVQIQNDDGGGSGTSLPNGTNANINLSSTFTYTPSNIGTWEKLSFPTQGTLAAGKYWIVLTAQTIQANDNSWSFALDTSPTYTGGHRAYSTNAGASWTAAATQDALFRIYGTSDPVKRSQSIIII